MSNQTIESPCVNICKLDEDGVLCVGCYRSRSEIGEWGFASDERKQRILQAASERRHR